MKPKIAPAFDYEATYYETYYPNYEAQNPDRKIAFYRHTLEKHWNDSLPKRVHDIGCAFGRFLSSLSGWEIYGSDASHHAIESARERMPNGNFVADAGANGLPFSVKFGAVTAFDVLEHVPDLDALAGHINRELAPKGIFVFVVPVYDGLSGPLIRKLDKDPTHIHKWARGAWLEWAEKHFEVLEWNGILRYLLPVGGYLHLPTRLFRGHTPAILVAARRK